MNIPVKKINTLFEPEESEELANFSEENQPKTYFEEDEQATNYIPASKKIPSVINFGTVLKIKTSRIQRPMVGKPPRFKTIKKFVVR